MSVLNLLCQNARIVNLYAFNETATWVSNCSFLLGATYGSINNLNASTITNLANLNVSEINIFN